MFGYFWLAIFLISNVAERVMGRDLPGSLPMLLATSCLGQAIYLAHNGGIKRASLWLLATSNVIIIPLASFIGLDKAGEWPPLVYSVSYLGGLALFGLAFALRNLPGGIVLQWLGSISYSMYLLPPVVMGIINQLAGDALWLGNILGIIFVPLTAWLAYRYIETPFNQIGKGLTSSKRISSRV